MAKAHLLAEELGGGGERGAPGTPPNLGAAERTQQAIREAWDQGKRCLGNEGVFRYNSCPPPSNLQTPRLAVPLSALDHLQMSPSTLLYNRKSSSQWGLGWSCWNPRHLPHFHSSLSTGGHDNLHFNMRHFSLKISLFKYKSKSSTWSQLKTLGT